MARIYTYRTRHRVSLDRDYRSVFANRLVKSRGPLTVFLRANDLPEHRLGLSVGKRVGNAVVRGKLKRLIRESFRLDRSVYPRPSLGQAYDIVVSGRRHKSLSLHEYRAALKAAVEAAHREHLRRSSDQPTSS